MSSIARTNQKSANNSQGPKMCMACSVQPTSGRSEKSCPPCLFSNTELVGNTATGPLEMVCTGSAKRGGKITETLIIQRKAVQILQTTAGAHRPQHPEPLILCFQPLQRSDARGILLGLRLLKQMPCEMCNL